MEEQEPRIRQCIEILPAQAEEQWKQEAERQGQGGQEDGQEDERG